MWWQSWESHLAPCYSKCGPQAIDIKLFVRYEESQAHPRPTESESYAH